MENALKMANLNPAGILHREKITGALLPGRDADVVVFDDAFNVLLTLVKGEVKNSSISTL